jgi:hypothetical protein
MAITIETSALTVKSTLGLLRASGGTGPYSWQIIDGQLPPGLVFRSDGTITGTADASGTATVTVRCTDSGVPGVGAELADASISLTF